VISPFRKTRPRPGRARWSRVMNSKMARAQAVEIDEFARMWRQTDYPERIETIGARARASSVHGDISGRAVERPRPSAGRAASAAARLKRPHPPTRAAIRSLEPARGPSPRLVPSIATKASFSRLPTFRIASSVSRAPRSVEFARTPQVTRTCEPPPCKARSNRNRWLTVSPAHPFGGELKLL